MENRVPLKNIRLATDIDPNKSNSSITNFTPYVRTNF